MPVTWSIQPEARSHMRRELPRLLVGPPSLWGPSAPEFKFSFLPALHLCPALLSECDTWPQDLNEIAVPLEKKWPWLWGLCSNLGKL